MRGGKHSELAKPAFPPRAPPFRARSCCMLWKCEYVLVGRWILRCWQCNVTPIYTQVESAAPRLDISRQTETAWKETVASTRALMNAGLANESAVSQMEAAYYQVQGSVLDLQQQINQVENSLAL